jgi:formamidopyrimidine-DNA glycosylase
MPELPEVEVLARHLAPLLEGRRVRRVTVFRPRVVRPQKPEDLARALQGARFLGLRRRGKYLVFALRRRGVGGEFALIGHLGMTGRMYLLPARAALPRHCAVALDLGRHRLVFEDTRYFGRLTLDARVLDRLGPEPLDGAFTPTVLAAALHGSRQAVKVRLLDQAVVAGLGNIYASEALFRARLSPRRPAGALRAAEIRRLHAAIRTVLTEAIRFGSTAPLDWAGAAGAAAGAGGAQHVLLPALPAGLSGWSRAGQRLRRWRQWPANVPGTYPAGRGNCSPGFPRRGAVARLPGKTSDHAPARSCRPDRFAVCLEHSRGIPAAVRRGADGGRRFAHPRPRRVLRAPVPHPAPFHGLPRPAGPAGR